MKVVDLQIGMYRCKAHADQLPNGKYVGIATMRWEVSNATKTEPRYFDKVCDSEDEAIHHAIEQIDLLVKNGDL